MSKYSEIIRLLRARKQGVDGVVRAPRKHERLAADAITKLEAEKAELVECIRLLAKRCGPRSDDGAMAKKLLAKLEAGQ